MAHSHVNYNYLGRSGVRVSNLCLGTFTFGKATFLDVPTQADETLSHQIMDRYIELGGNFLDTANIYGHGASERVIGNWLRKQDRSQFILATKVGYPIHNSVNSVGLSRRHIVESCEQSLERLQTSYVDLLQAHAWDSETPIEETLRTFDDLIRCGKICYFGVSNFCGWQMQKMVEKIKTMGLNSCVTLQQHYNLLCRQSEFEEFMVCANEGIGVLPWSPLKGGLLTGKFKRDQKPEGIGSRIGFVHIDESKAIHAAPAWSQYNSDDSYWNLITKLTEIAKKYGRSVAQVSLRWLLQKDIVASVVFGATSVKQLEDNMGAGSGWMLTDDEMTCLENSYPWGSMYPYDQNVRMNTFNRSNKI